MSGTRDGALINFQFSSQRLTNPNSYTFLVLLKNIHQFNNVLVNLGLAIFKQFLMIK